MQMTLAIAKERAILDCKLLWKPEGDRIIQEIQMIFLR